MRRKVYLLAPALTVVGLGVIASIAWALSGGAASPSVPSSMISCGTCHSMEQEVMTWVQGSHGDVACLQCHRENDAAWVRHEFAERTQTMAATPVTPAIHAVPIQMPDERCENCHAPQLEALSRGMKPPPIQPAASAAAHQPEPLSIRVEHDVHINGNPGLKCVDCHTIHGPLPDTSDSRDLYHQRCQNCHDEEQVAIAVTGTVSCAACHNEAARVAPGNHKNETQWLKDHGEAGKSRTCGQCHLAQSAGPHDSLSSPEAFPSQTQDACLACHAGVTMPHQPNFLAVHGQGFLAAATGTCESCHSPDQSPIKPTPHHATATFCTDCHAQPMPHPAAFMPTHGTLALKSPATCTACHSARNPVNAAAPHASAGLCATCHDTYRHPAGWIGTHGESSLTAPRGTCEACHAPNQNRDKPAAHASAQFCSDCHAQPMPHPAAFRPAHGKEALQAPATCATCHSVRNPANPTAPHASAQFCAGCHDAYRHPAGWVGSHGDRVTEACATCHTVEMKQTQPGQHNACSVCHTGGAWHPKMWFISHGQAVRDQGQEGCMKCHEAIEPKCSECHRSR